MSNISIRNLDWKSHNAYPMMDVSSRLLDFVLYNRFYGVCSAYKVI